MFIGNETYLERLHERHRALVLDEPALREQLAHLLVVDLVVLGRVRVPDRLHALLLPLRERGRDVDAHRARPLRVVRRLALLALVHLLEQAELSVAHGLDGAPHVLRGVEDRLICRSRLGPTRELYGIRLVENSGPNMFREVRCDGADDKSGDADPPVY